MHVPKNPILKGKACWLRKYEKEDFEPYFETVNDAETAFLTGFTGPQSKDEAEGWIDKLIKDGQYCFVISPIGSHDFLGTALLWNLNGRFGGGEVAILVSGAKNRSKGIGTDAVNLLLDFGFGNLNLHRIWLSTKESNHAARKSFSKAGFSLEGVIRDDQYRNGEFHNSVLMSILIDEWRKMDRARYWDNNRM